MNRFFVFTGETYYPAGGLGDLNGTAATLEEAMAMEVTCGKWGTLQPDWGYIAEYDGKGFVSVKIWNGKTWEDALVND